MTSEVDHLSPASDSLSSLDSKLRHSAYAHLRVARAQCVYGFIFSRIFGHVWMPYYRRRAYKRSRGSRDKYSVHQKAFSFTAGASPTTATLSSFSSVTLLQATWTSVAPAATLSPSSDHHITPQIYISYEICGARRCSIP